MRPAHPRRCACRSHRAADRPPGQLHREPPDHPPVLPGPRPSSLVNGPARRDSAYEPAGRAEEPIAGPPEKTPGRTREAREAQRRPQHLIRAMPAEGNRLAGPLRAHQLLPTAVDWHTAIRSGPAPAPPAAPRSKWLTPPARRGLSASRTIPDTPRIGRSSCDRLDRKTRRPPFRFGRESVGEAAGPASLALTWRGRRVRGLGPGLTSDSADAVRVVLRNDLSAGPQVFWHPPALPV